MIEFVVVELDNGVDIDVDSVCFVLLFCSNVDGDGGGGQKA